MTPVLLANHMPVIAVAMVGGFFGALVLGLFYLERRINRQFKPPERARPRS